MHVQDVPGKAAAASLASFFARLLFGRTRLDSRYRSSLLDWASGRVRQHSMDAAFSFSPSLFLSCPSAVSPRFLRFQGCPSIAAASG